MMTISERNKLDVGLVGTTITNSTATGKFHSMAGFSRACFHFLIGAMAASKVVLCQVWEALDSTGASKKLLPTATCTVTANILVNKATVTMNTVQALDTVTVNGLVFTAHATVTDVSIRQFSCATGNNETAAQLVLCLNAVSAGVPGLTASAASAVVTLVSTEPGETLITTASSGATIVLATTEASAYVSVDNLDLDATFTHLAAYIDSTATGICAVSLLRTPQNVPPAQVVGASTVLT
jgi:hypothetical protein